MYDALLVAGTHIYRADVMMLSHALKRCPIRKLFGGEHEQNAGWFGNLEFVRVPPVGKYTIDRTIAMEAIRLHLQQGVNHILIASPRSWMGEAAMQLRQLYPNLHISLAVNEKTLDSAVQERLRATGIACDPVLEHARPIVTSQVFNIFRDLQKTSPHGNVATMTLYQKIASTDPTLPLLPSLSDKKRFVSTMQFFGIPVGHTHIAENHHDFPEGISPCL